jgi:hypothetical protein
MTYFDDQSLRHFPKSIEATEWAANVEKGIFLSEVCSPVPSSQFPAS